MPLTAVLPPEVVTTNGSPLVQAALALWRDGGYHRHGLADLAAHAGADVLTYPCKEALTVDLWRALNHETWSQIDELSPSHMAQRFGQTLSAKLAQLSPYRAALAALYAHSATDESSPWRPPHGLSDPMLDVYRQVVIRSTDLPSKPEEVEQLATLFYGLQHFVVLFWLYDRTQGQRATHMLADFLQEAVRIMRPMMMMPIFSKALAKVAELLQIAFSEPHASD
ncbi:MAG: TetR/AcrR family transcriptional regulator [Anaerolineae bacterium]|nr:TetR/AcrR family transcriptional regulator [Anaerolineae bacterium]MDW8171738.1 TetR/AcrR family transcriptional regulator [Anaerolineae bacterium]